LSPAEKQTLFLHLSQINPTACTELYKSSMEWKEMQANSQNIFQDLQLSTLRRVMKKMPSAKLQNLLLSVVLLFLHWVLDRTTINLLHILRAAIHLSKKEKSL